MTHPVRRAVVILVAVLVAMLAAKSGEAAGPIAPENVRSYVGPRYSALPDASPTEFETQSKLWFHDGAWWALMLTPSGALSVHELDADHTWRLASEPLTADPIAVGDVLPGPEGVQVIFSDGAGLHHARLTYDVVSRQYALGSGSVALVTDRSGRSAAIAVDSTGRLWVALVTRSQVLVTSSSTGGADWSELVPPAVDGTDIAAGEIAAVVAFDQSIGVMWSDQTRDRFSFAIHRDGTPLDQWTLEVMLDGTGLTDDHINLKVAGGPAGDTIVAGIKTSQNDRENSADAPLMVVLARPPSGVWSAHVASTVADQHNRPLIVVDETNRQVYFIAQAPERGGNVYFKRAALDQLTFEEGRGTPLIEGDSRIGEATAGRAPVTSRTGLVVLASSPDTSTYHHAELVIPAPGGGQPPVAAEDDVPPPPPEGLVGTQNGSDSVVLYWSASVDTGRWSPARDGTPVKKYVVLRDGEEIGGTGRLSFVDRPPEGSGTYEYAVAAVDGAGNRSLSAASASVQVSSNLSALSRGIAGAGWYLALFGVLAAAGPAVLIARRRD